MTKQNHEEANVSQSHHDTYATSEHAIRCAKVQQLRQMGIEPWPEYEEIPNTCREVIEQFDETVSPPKQYKVAGRIVSIRIHGKTAFAHIQDRTGKLQVYIRSDDITAQQFDIFKQYIDLGDIIACTGYSFRTKMGEITLHVTSLTLLSKCLYPLPEKFHGLTDMDIKYRQRYLDLITNEETKKRFRARSIIIEQLRRYLLDHDFIEVETPMLHPIPGGAAARPFVTHHNTLHEELYLRIAPELYLKRLVIGGFERVFEINRNFRNEGVSTRHNPEFTMLELYMAHEDYQFAMEFVEDMLRKMIQAMNVPLQLPYGEHTLDFAQPFERISIKEAVVRYGGIRDHDLQPHTIDATCARFNIIISNAHTSVGEKLFLLFEEVAEKNLINPTFIIDFPIETSPLSRRKPYDPQYAARFELFINGMELANGFNELNDPADQAARFQEQARAHGAGNIEAMRYDAEYVHALEYGLPPTVGVGIGIDRLVMLLTNTLSIKEVILFPAVRRNKDVTEIKGT